MINLDEWFGLQECQTFGNEMHKQGFSIFSNVLGKSECDFLKSIYSERQYYRKTILMKKYRFGKGEYKCFVYSLSEILGTLRHRFFEMLSPIVNQWMEQLNISWSYTESEIIFDDAK